MSLVELIISMAISAIVLSMIMIIISIASKSFRRTNDEVNLQLEAQTTMNQLSNLIMEAGRIEESANKPSSADKKYMISTGSKCYALLLIKDDMRLYLMEGNTKEEADTAAYSPEANLMGEYIKDINISGLQLKKVTIDLTFTLGEDEYDISRTVKLRNKNK
jgi:type II secretory pathway pseudopilin PulG